jgi:hypothetical protein
MLLQKQQNDPQTNPPLALAGSMQYLMRHRKLPGKALRGLRDKFSLGSTARSPQGGFMKRNLIGTLSLVVLSLLIAATGASAQSFAKANVPFAFKVGQAQLPAGCYRITAGYAHSTIMVRNCETGKAVMSLRARTEYARATTPKLVFHHLGNRYFLTEIWGAGGSTGMILPASKLERELRVASGPSNASGEVVLALN